MMDWKELMNLDKFDMDVRFGEFRVDVEEDDEVVRVTADLPGYDTEDIDVSVKGRHLKIEAGSEEHHEHEEDSRYMLNERRTMVSRTIPLPRGVDVESGHAEYNNGVLTVEFEREHGQDGHHIEVK